MSSWSVTTDIPPGLQTLFGHFGREVVRVTQDLCLSEEKMTSIPIVMRDFNCLQRLDISRNLFRSLPVMLMNEYFPVLQELDVSHNRLSDMNNVRQLGTMPHLQRLNLLGNPLVTVNQRDSLLNHLIFSGRRPAEEEIRGVLGVEPDLLLEDTLPLRSNVISSESISKMLISGISPGNIPPHTAIKLLSSTNSASARPVIYCDLNAAPVPRNTPFPWLTHLNGLAISKEDIDLAGAHRSQPLHTSAAGKRFFEPQARIGIGRRLGTKALQSADVREGAAQATEEQQKGKGKGKKDKLRGRKLVEQLERDLESLLWQHKEQRVQKTLARLLRDGVLDSASGGEATPDAEYMAEFPQIRALLEQPSSATQAQPARSAVRAARRRAEGGRKEADRNGREEEAEQQQEKQEERARSPAPRAHRSPSARVLTARKSVRALDAASGSEGSSDAEEKQRGDEEGVGAWEEAMAEDVLGTVLRKASQRPSTALRIELMARKAQGGGQVVVAGGSEGSGKEAVAGRQHRQSTHPPAWWDAERGAEVGAEEEALPTRLTVLEQGREELEGTKQSLRRIKAIGVMAGDKWTRLKYKTALTELTKVAAGESDADAEGAADGGAEEGGAQAPGGGGAQTLSFGDVLKAELEDQRERDTTFLELELPKKCRKLKIEAWMREKKEVEGVTEEIERLFTATNIHNKMASSQGVRGGGSHGLSLATHQKRAQDQKNQELFSARLSKHQDRLKVIAKGGWPGMGKQGAEGAAAGQRRLGSTWTRRGRRSKRGWRG